MSTYVANAFNARYLKQLSGNNGGVITDFAQIGAEEDSAHVLIIEYVAVFVVPAGIDTLIGDRDLEQVYIVVGISFGTDSTTQYYTTWSGHSSFPLIPIHTQVFEYTANNGGKMFNAGLLEEWKYQCMEISINYELGLNPRLPDFDASVKFIGQDLILTNTSQLELYGFEWDGPDRVPDEDRT